MVGMKLLVFNILAMAVLFGVENPTPLSALLFGLCALGVLSRAHELKQAHNRLRSIGQAQIDIQRDHMRIPRKE